MASIRKNTNRVPTNGRGRSGSSSSSSSSTSSSSSSSLTLEDIFNRHSTRSAINPQGLNPHDSNFSDLLGRLTAGSDDSIMQVLRALGIQQKGGLKIAQRDDWNKQLLDTLTNYLLTLDNRNYNESMRDEQRIYDSPTNQLSRLMGAGVSRDAAIQMLSGGSQPIQSDAPSAAEGIAPSESMKNGVDSVLAPIQTALDAISTVGGLVSLGFSMPQAIQQTRALKYGNFMNQQQQNAFNSVNSLTNALQTAVSDGILTAQDLEGWSNANDAYKWLNDHADTNFVKPLADSGVLQGVFGSTIGREMFNSHWQQMRDARSGGELYDSFLRQQHLAEILSQWSSNEKRANYYATLNDTFIDVLKSEPEIANLWQSYKQALREYDISGEELKQEGVITSMLEREDEIGRQEWAVQFSALSNVDLNTGMTGAELLSYSLFSEMIDAYEHAYATTAGSDFSGKGALVPTADGKQRIGITPRHALQDFYAKNRDAAIASAFVMDLVNSNRLTNYKGDLSPFYSFADAMRYSGGNEVLSTMFKGVQVGAGIYVGSQLGAARAASRGGRRK